MTPAIVLAVLAAGGLGALLRYAVTVAVESPWAVLVVNVVGSALAGAVLGLGADLDPGIRLVLLTGFAGGLTTFSTFSLETIQLALDGKLRLALGNVALNVVLGVGAAAAAYLLTR